MRSDDFYERIDPPDEGELCPELRCALAAMRAVEPFAIAAMGVANVKAPEFVCILDRAPSQAAVDAAKSACRHHPELNFVESGIGCREHLSELDWQDRLIQRQPAQGGWWSRLWRMS